MRNSIKRNPRKPVNYLPLIPDLSEEMIRAYKLGYNQAGSSLSMGQRAKKKREFSLQAREALEQYQVSSNTVLQDAYMDAIKDGRSDRQAVQQVLRRFRSLGIDAPATGRLETLYKTALYGAFEQGIYDGSQVNDEIWGYRYWTRNDEKVRHPEHSQFNGVTLPKDDPFWLQIWPPIAWNCRCWIVILKRKHKIVRPPLNPVPVESGFAGQGFQLN